MDTAWHPVALSSDLETATSSGIRLDGRELVVWRDDKGEAHVWEDRCPHRGMRLSFGFVRGDHLACLYHGWQYDRTGQCRYIPAHPDLEVPSTITVPVFKTREWAGIIWASLDDSAAPGETIEDIPATPLRSAYLAAGLPEAVRAFVERGFGNGSEVRKLEGNLCLVKADGHQLLAAFQPIGPERTGMHVVLLETVTSDMLRHFAFSVEAFRDSLAVEAG